MEYRNAPTTDNVSEPRQLPHTIEPPRCYLAAIVMFAGLSCLGTLFWHILRE